MRSNIPTMVAGLAFVTLAITNVLLMLLASSTSRSAKTKSRLIAVHRLAGYLFAILLSIMAYIMSRRLAGLGITGRLPTYLVFHIVLVLSLVPLLLLKILIARFYKQNYSLLMALGMGIFLVSFVLVAIPAFSALLREAKPESLALKFATALLVAVCLVQFLVILRRTGMQPRATAESVRVPQISTPAISSVVGQSREGPMTLVLAQIERQTHDTRSLRFLLPKERRLRFRPGQFLTFRWQINGQTVPRSYTISSSAIHAEYVEITPKRIENGCVSVFLNDRAEPGLAVEAHGPYGQFCFDPEIHASIVLIAAGSGITPMMSMLRYIDDFKLVTPVVLLYCVRTGEDIIFKAELERLGRSLPNFSYSVCLSQPDEAWKGPSGRLTKEFVLQHVSDLGAHTFFLCGPKGFMQSARQILSTLGVSQNRILQESFGENRGPAESRAAELRTATVVFMHSQRVCQVSDGNTVLEIAEKNGVQIPYGCRKGQCGTCVTRLLSGTVRMDADAGLTDEQKSAGCVLPCVSRAEGTVVMAA